MTQLAISLLGTVQVTRDGQPVTDQAYAKVLGLLAYLAVEADRPHSRATLATLFWPEQTDERARHSLRQALSTLRKILREETDSGQYFSATREFVQFNRDSDYTLDVQRVMDLLDACERHEHQRLETCPACAQRLEQVVAAFRGDFLEGFAVDDSTSFEDWMQIWRQRIRQKVINAASTLAAWHEHRDALDLASAAVLRQLELDPWQESAHRTLMELLWRRGLRTEAMAQYERCRKVLDEELGVEPDEETTALYELISAPGSKPRPVSGKAARALHGHRVPVQAGRLVGRERDLEEIADLLAQRDCRLLTLTGAGGSGKTRLAIQVATDQTHHFVGSVCFVSLAEIREADGIVPAIADELGMRLLGNVDPERQLLDWMRDRSIFLVLDNAEHLIDGMVIVARMLASVPSVSILTTSRERLHLQGEWVYEVNGLDVPASDATDSFEGYGSVDLFGERLRQVRPRTPLRHEERPTVVRICHLVGGLPLAIELAAAWAQSLTLEQIEDGVRKNLDFLSTSMRDTPVRHRSMRAVFNQTWQMLTPEEQAAYRRLSVFQDGFRLEAAEAVTDTSSLQLAALVGKSLLTRQPTGRYRLHGLLRQYADELVQRDAGEYTQLHDRHCTFYLEHLASQEDALIGSDQRTALNEIEDDIGNVRAAWDWAVHDRKVLLIEEAAHALWLFYVIRGRMREGATAFGNVLEALDADGGSELVESRPVMRARATSLVRYGGFQSGLGRYNEGITSISHGIVMMRDARRDTGTWPGAQHACGRPSDERRIAGVEATARGESPAFPGGGRPVGHCDVAQRPRVALSFARRRGRRGALLRRKPQDVPGNR